MTKSNDRKYWDKLCRTNTGSNFLDSGDHYGRNYDRPLSKDDIIINKDENNHLESMHIHLPAFFEVALIRDKQTATINRMFMAWSKRHDSWNIECFLDDMHESGKLTEYTYDNVNNTYNSENDFDQEFLFHVLKTNDDWYYSENTILFVSPHCGCDIRGGYPKPVAAKLRNECFLDWSIGLYVSEKDGTIVEDFDCLELGYSYNPQYELEKHDNIKHILVNDDGSMTLMTNDNRELECYPDHRLNYY